VPFSKHCLTRSSLCSIKVSKAVSKTKITKNPEEEEEYSTWKEVVERGRCDWSRKP